LKEGSYDCHEIAIALTAGFLRKIVALEFTKKIAHSAKLNSLSFSYSVVMGHLEATAGFARAEDPSNIAFGRGGPVFEFAHLATQKLLTVLTNGDFLSRYGLCPVAVAAALQPLAKVGGRRPGPRSFCRNACRFPLRRKGCGCRLRHR